MNCVNRFCYGNYGNVEAEIYTCGILIVRPKIGIKSQQF